LNLFINFFKKKTLTAFLYQHKIASMYFEVRKLQLFKTEAP